MATFGATIDCGATAFGSVPPSLGRSEMQLANPKHPNTIALGANETKRICGTGLPIRWCAPERAKASLVDVSRYAMCSEDSVRRMAGQCTKGPPVGKSMPQLTER